MYERLNAVVLPECARRFVHCSSQSCSEASFADSTWHPTMVQKVELEPDRHVVDVGRDPNTVAAMLWRGVGLAAWDSGIQFFASGFRISREP